MTWFAEPRAPAFALHPMLPLGPIQKYFVPLVQPALEQMSNTSAEGEVTFDCRTVRGVPSCPLTGAMVVAFVVPLTDHVEGRPVPEPLPEPHAPQTMLVPLLVKHWPAAPALVRPVPPFAIPNAPATPPFPLTVRFTAGISEFVSDRKAGAPGVPEAGPAKIVFAFSLAMLASRVPEVVTGDPVTLKIEGSERLTLVTVPAAGKVAGAQAEPLH